MINRAISTARKVRVNVQPVTHFEIPHIHGYEPLQFLGEGGYGRVYKYLQTGSLRREVAIKVIRSDLACKEVVARFEIESKALARCNHPNIASVYEVGSTEHGLPYIVMELCSGTPLSEWIINANPSLESRVEAIRLACTGVSHAHSKGIVHRDIKPKNIMVDDSSGELDVKVIDFGLAKAVDEPLNEFSTVTGRRSGIGTWEYMSPEQSRGTEDGSTEVGDVYSLGGVLYFVLTGISPHGRLKGIPESLMLKKINEEFVRDPSEVVKSASLRGAGYCTDQIPTELNFICQKAISIESHRRYQTVSQMMSDLELSRNKSGPLLASSPSVFYKAMFFMRLYKKGVAIVFLSFVALVVNLQMAIHGIGQLEQSNLEKSEALYSLETKSSQLRESMEIIEAKKNEADKNLRQLETMLAFHAQQISQVNIGDLANKVKAEYETREKAHKILTGLAGINNDDSDSGTASVESSAQNLENVESSRPSFDFTWIINESLREGVFGELGNSLSLLDDEPELHAKISEFYSKQFVELGYWDQSLILQRSVVELRKKFSPEFEESLWRSEFSLGHIYGLSGEYLKSHAVLEKLLNNRHELENCSSLDEGEMLGEISLQNLMLGNYGAAEKGFQQALSLLESNGFGNEKVVSIVLSRQGLLYLEVGRVSDAAECFKKSRELREQLPEQGGVEFVNLLTNEGKYFAEIGDTEKAYEYFNNAWKECADHLGMQHPKSLVCRNNLGYTYLTQGKYDKAYEQYASIIRVIEESYNGVWRSEYFTVLNNLGVLHKKRGDYESSEQYYLKCLDGYGVAFDSNHPKRFGVLVNYAVLKMYIKEYDEALKLFDEANELGSSFLIPDSTDLLFCQANLGFLCSLKGDGEKAIRLLKSVLGKYRSSLGIQSADTQMVLSDLLNQYEKSSHFGHAIELVTEILAEVETSDPQPTNFYFQLLIRRSSYLHQHGSKVKALEELSNIRKALSEAQNLDQEINDRLLEMIQHLDQKWESGND